MATRRTAHTTPQHTQMKKPAHTTAVATHKRLHPAAKPATSGQYEAFLALAAGVQKEVAYQRERVDTVMDQLRSHSERLFAGNTALRESTPIFGDIGAAPSVSEPFDFSGIAAPFKEAATRSTDPFNFSSVIATPVSSSPPAISARDTLRLNQLEQISADWKQDQQQLITSPRAQLRSQHGKNEPQMTLHDSNTSEQQHLSLPQPNFDASTNHPQAEIIHPVDAHPLATSANHSNSPQPNPVLAPPTPTLYYPALARRSAHHFASHPSTSSDTPDPFPALARVMRMRESRLVKGERRVELQSSVDRRAEEKEDSTAQSHATFPATSTSSQNHSAAQSSRDLATQSTRSSPSGAVTLEDLEPQGQQSPLPALTAEETEARDVKLLLKQQALQLLCEHVQTRIRKMTVSCAIHHYMEERDYARVIHVDGRCSDDFLLFLPIRSLASPFLPRLASSFPSGSFLDATRTPLHTTIV